MLRLHGWLGAFGAAPLQKKNSLELSERLRSEILRLPSLAENQKAEKKSKAEKMQLLLSASDHIQLLAFSLAFRLEGLS